jgi:hypothetical protein
MTDLSPAAQAVWDAWEKTPVSLDIVQTDREALAAALRAAADQVVPFNDEMSTWARLLRNVRSEFLSIANELDPP